MNEEEAAGEAVDRIDFLSIQFKNCQEENRTLKGEQEKLQADMMQIIRCSQTEKLTQELVDTFICDMFFMWRLVTPMMLTYNKVERENMVQRRHLWQSV